VYEIAYTVSDSNGGECSGTTTVTVLHSQKRGAIAIDSGQDYDSFV
jgi:hypothetical protein